MRVEGQGPYNRTGSQELNKSNSLNNELLQSSIAKTPENHSERLIGHLESQTLFLQREFKEKDQLVNSLLDQISKCNDIIKTNQELSKE